MRRATYARVMLASLSAACALASPPAAAQADMDQRLERLDAFLSAFEERAMFNGTVIVDIAGTVVFERSYGFADYENEIPFNAGTRFRIASVSKDLTDAALAVLVERGEIARDTPLSQFVPDFPRADEITLAMLVEHSAGVPHTNAQGWGDASASVPRDEIIARLAALPLDFEPGTDRSHSNGGYALLARVIEVATGMSYGEAMAALVFEPLGMDDTGDITDARAVIAAMARGYEPGPAPGSRRHSRFYAVETRPGGGSLYASARDVLTAARAILRDGFPGEAGQAAFMTIGSGLTGSSGRSPGFGSTFVYDHSSDVLIVSLGNNYAAEFRWSEALLSLVTGDEPLFEAPEIAAAFPPELLESLPGAYGFVNPNYSQRLRIVRVGDGLALGDEESDFLAALLPLAGGGFLDTMYFGRCAPSEDEPGLISCTRLYVGGFSTDMRRRAAEE